MNAGFQLVRHSARRYRKLVLTVSLLLGAFQVLLVLAARALDSMGAFGAFAALIPDFVKQLLGESTISMLSFGGVVCLGYFHLAVVGALVALAVALGTESAAEIEGRFVDFVMARPVHRHWPITRSLILLVAGTSIPILLMRTGTWVGLEWVAPAEAKTAALRTSGLLAWNLAVVTFCWGTVGLAVASFARRRGAAGAITGVLALSTYLLDYVARIWSPAQWTGRFSPFRYYSALDIVVSGRIPPWSIVVLLVTSAAAAAIAYAGYRYRDL